MRRLGLLGLALLGFLAVVAIATVGTVALSDLSLALNPQGRTQVILQVQPTEAVSTITEQDMEAVQQVIDRRAKALGGLRASVEPLAQNQLQVQIPGAIEPAQIERLLTATAQLEFRAQEPVTEEPLRVEMQLLQQHELELAALLENQVPPESTPNSEVATNAASNEQIAAAQEAIADSNTAIAELFAPASITGTRLTDAQAQESSGSGMWEIAIEFDAEGTDQFAQLTRDVAGTGLAIGIFVDGRLISAPTVNVAYAETGITGGSAVISGGFSAESANDLAIQLRSGALPLPVEVLEIRFGNLDAPEGSAASGLYADALGSLAALFLQRYTSVRV
ncbi:MAG: hypothetical protein AAFQ89_16830 [Cyanobacteria bacterium J06626_18]